jgi:2-oxoglutarate ferredoxin oxidoreductase subunit alpha
VQEAIDQIALAFDLADKYRNIVHVVVDGNMGQMMEPAELPPMRELPTEPREWAISGAKDRDPNILTSIYIDPVDEEVTNLRLFKRWMEIEKNEVRYTEQHMDDAEYAVIGFGTAGRVASSAVKIAREEGIKVGLFRPITLAPFPKERIREISEQVKRILVVEMNTGMMLDDITAITKETVPVEFYGRLGGMTPLPDEILDEIHRIVKNKAGVRNPRQEWTQRLEQLINGGK